MNNKAAIPSIIGDFMGYLAFAVVLVIFYFLFNIGVNIEPEPKGIDVEAFSFSSVTAQQFLLNYLKTPVYLPEREPITMADYIVLKYNQNKLEEITGTAEKSVIKGAIKEDLDKLVKETGMICYDFQVSKEEETVIIVHGDFEPKQTGCPRNLVAVGVVNIPTDNGELLTIRLVMYNYAKKT